MIDDGRPLFLQIAELIEGSIVDGTLVDGAQAPSTNELAAFYRINPATAAKGVNLLVEKDVLRKQRGIGMFVSHGARERLIAERHAAFSATYVAPLVREATKLGLSTDEVITLIRTQPQTNTEGNS